MRSPLQKQQEPKATCGAGFDEACASPFSGQPFYLFFGRTKKKSLAEPKPQVKAQAESKATKEVSDPKDAESPSLTQDEKNQPIAKEKVREAAKLIGLKKTSKIPDISTIRQSINSKQHEKKDDHLKIGTDPVSVDQLKEEWHSFADMLKNNGRDREYNTLNQEVEFHDDLSIRLMLPNSFQSLTIEGLQQELLTYLRSKLNNSTIQLITEIEKVENKKLIYTNSEKFDYLAEKYPNLKDLKKRLDLDTDF